MMLLALAIAQAAPVEVRLPYEWLEYCATAPAAQCRVATITTVDVAWINYRVNTAISPRPDAPGEERWTAFPADRKGDCDEYALTKRSALLALGMAPEALRLEFGQVFRGGEWIDHIVLIVSIEGKDWVLDNLEQTVMYSPASRPRPWRSISMQTPNAVLWKDADQ